MTVTAVFDVGKTNVKLSLVDRSGTSVWSRTRANTVQPGPPYPHFDTDGLWHWLLSTLSEAGREHPIGAIIPICHGGSITTLNGDAPGLPVMDYEHLGIEDINGEYEALRDDFAQTLCPSLPGGLNAGRQLFWMARRMPERWADVTAIVPYPQYWVWRLSGVIANEYTSIACHSDLWRPLASEYSGLVKQMGWERLLPPLVPAGTDMGPLRPELRAETGLGEATRVINGLHDSNASYLRHLVSHDPPFTVLSTGTWIITLAAEGNADCLDKDRDTLAFVDVNGDAVPGARFMGGREYGSIADDDPVDFAVADLTAVIEKGAMALPEFVPGTGPYPKRRPAIDGDLASDHERSALATLYCALVSEVELDLTGSGGDIIIEGRFAENEAYCRLMASLCAPRRVRVSQDSTGTSGAGAYLAMAGKNRDTALAILGSRALTDAEPLDLPGLKAYRDAWRVRADS